VQTFTVPTVHALFDELPADERAMVEESFRLERQRQGERFSDAVEISSLILVVSGRVRVFIAGPDERELTLALLDAGEALSTARGRAGSKRSRARR
jgi:hypothetical protein